MRAGWFRQLFFFAFLAAAQSAAPAQAGAPKLPPVEPPKAMPSRSQATLSVTATEVLAPTLVEKRDGEIIYGLKPKDFILEDNGVAQKIHVQEEMDTAPVALVVAVELGGASVLEFDKLAKLGPLLDLFLTDPRSEVALVGFDSTQHLIQDFTHAGDQVNRELKNLEPGDGKAAILDTISYSVNLLQSQPKSYRRVLLLISEKRDHGSKHARIAHIIQQVGESDVLVLGVSFSPIAAEFAHDVKDSGDDRTMNMVSALAALVQAFRKNVTKEIAAMSGGEYTSFTGDRKFEAQVVDAAKHARNRYLITFSPSNPTPGLHTLRVRTAEDYGARIVARANYWIGPEAR
ncbi:MAG: VWA domain-containing protein [Acidobacteriota bacterium]